MIAFLVNLLLAIAWVAVSGSASLHNLVFGFVLGAVALAIVREPFGSKGYLHRTRLVLSLALLFLKELALSAWTVARTVLRPRMEIRPGIFAFPLTVDRDLEITLLANLITLTPGTLSVDVSEDRRTLYVHALDCADPEATKRAIASGFERKIMEAFR
ncbi:Na+/H+ antiporter subunit E [Rhizobium mongolense]|jgi:multicomponent Na+:H+ antiporter subunit E|uniref:Na+/H+ antiporter subunit E n=1 Tax=Rhizobium gallicum bv. gallicum R602sp TaxID=1041138 RepID=A0A0B4WY31_9HYPH|nr:MULTISPECIES: Na+/H+ antiporter subunit E [Rhizobium]TDW27683.1 multicomponent Na+:H+ antiporter subunit E [Rhizobium azibense]AJD40524.1 Na+/H+ antiporter subunit E [Rhizobium gallicum bv. gallicum R602sp]NNH31547.1 Na+/H+ antiporter subunit E [Rhizobium sp. SEMIA 4085]ULJ70571.1 Na+/H+ antiporter subunit E [Rhizobium gallicum]WFU88263.1 Na+/H+ antiporter subunit E [Rhizobium sp. CC1099]